MSMTLADIREQYPQYNDLSDQALADALHAKFYSDIDKAEFYNRVGLRPSLPDDDGNFAPLSAARPQQAQPKDDGTYLSRAADAFKESTGENIGFDPENYAAVKRYAGLAMPIVETAAKAGDVALGAMRSGTSLASDALYDMGVAPEGYSRDRARRGLDEAIDVMSMRAGAMPKVGKAADMATSVATTYGKQYAQNANSALSKITPEVARKAKSAFIKRAKGAKRLSNEEEALRRLEAALADDGISYQDLNKRLMEWDGQPVSRTDLIGDSGLARVRDTASNIGPAREILKQYSDEVMSSQGKRAREIITKALSDKTDYLDEMNALNVAREAKAKPLYDAAHAQVVAPTDQIKTLTGLRSGQKAIKNALEIAGEEQAGLAGVLKKNGKFVLDDNVPVKTLDYIKRGWDDLIETYRDKTTGRLVLDSTGKARNDNLRAFISEIDELSPDYVAARAVYAGPSASMDAMKQGQRFMASGRLDAKAMARQMADMTDGEKDFFRAGAVQDLLSKISKRVDSGNKFQVLNRNEDIREKIKVLFDGDEARANSFMDHIARETERTARAQQISTRIGSPTNIREKAAVQFDLADALDAGSPGFWARLGKKTIDTVKTKKAIQRQRDVDEAFARLMTQRIQTTEELMGLIPPPQ